MQSAYFPRLAGPGARHTDNNIYGKCIGMDWSSKLQSSHFLCHYNCFCNSNSSMGKDPADTMANIVRFNIYVIFMNCQFTDSWQSH